MHGRKANSSGGNVDRGATSVIGTVLLVGVAVIVAATVTVLALGLTDNAEVETPVVTVSADLVDAGSEKTVVVTHESGDSIPATNLYVVGSKDVDIGGQPGGPDSAQERFASERETFNEGGDQVDVGDRWEAGETIYLDPVGSVDGATIRIAWSKQPVESFNPGEPRGEDSFVIAEFTVGER